MHCYTDKEIGELIKVSCGLTKSLENLFHIKDKGVDSWSEKYNVPNLYNKARRFLTVPGMDKMFKRIEKIYKIVYEDEWSNYLNEETD